MTTMYPEPNAPPPSTGTEDDDDDRDDEHEGENEAPVREHDESTEAPEEFEVDDEDESGHPEDDDADEDDGELSAAIPSCRSALHLHQLVCRQHVVVQMRHDPHRSEHDKTDDQYAESQCEDIVGVVRSGGDVQE
jgi:hypothetical protein